jgi:MoaA/NifB/PqqE/SkfB family radical SAM enzyme
LRGGEVETRQAHNLKIGGAIPSPATKTVINKKMIIEDFKCGAPWQGLFVNPDGDCRVCCAGKTIGNLNKDTIENIINGPIISQVRKDILTKGHSAYCLNCMESEKTSGKSLRESYDTDLSKIDTTKFNAKILDIRWWNTCQLRCVYCNSNWSSSYAIWEGKTARVSKRNWQQEVVDFLKSGDTNFRDLHFLGGEPLLLRENIDLIDMAGPEARLGLVTNLSIENVDQLPVYKKFISRPTNWLVSLEATGNKFEYIRRNAKWNITKSNYEKLVNTTDKHINTSIGCHLTYCIFSAFSLTDTFDWLREIHKVKDENTSFVSILLGPTLFNIMYYPLPVRELAVKELDLLMDKHSDFLNDMTINSIKNLRKSLLEESHPVPEMDKSPLDLVKELLEFVEKTDLETYPVTFKEEWPELYQVLINIS